MSHEELPRGYVEVCRGDRMVVVTGPIGLFLCKSRNGATDSRSGVREASGRSVRLRDLAVFDCAVRRGCAVELFDCIACGYTTGVRA